MSTIQTIYPSGQHVEIFSKRILESNRRAISNEICKEHATPGIYSKPKEYTLVSVKSNIKWDNCRLTVDYQEDMDMVDKFITTYPDWFNYSNNQICELIMQNEFYKINEQHILKQQKTRNISENH